MKLTQFALRWADFPMRTVLFGMILGAGIVFVQIICLSGFSRGPIGTAIFSMLPGRNAAELYESLLMMQFGIIAAAAVCAVVLFASASGAKFYLSDLIIVTLATGLLLGHFILSEPGTRAGIRQSDCFPLRLAQALLAVILFVLVSCVGRKFSASFRIRLLLAGVLAIVFCGPWTFTGIYALIIVLGCTPKQQKSVFPRERNPIWTPKGKAGTLSTSSGTANAEPTARTNLSGARA